MAWTAGTRLGPYIIQSLLGAGGMGEVYKARDTRLDRTVAIKILPDALAAEPQFRERFNREARAISQLDHPHICGLYDVGEDRGTAFLVMQYLEGETLADRLKNGALPLDQALRYGTELADALDKAHRAGIVHRDLKPANVFLTKGGAKLLDFGLAKRGGTVVGGPGLSMLSTAPDDLTAQGTILGTLQYMAPEQLEGREADARADIFAFGAVLFEMITGRRAFDGRTQASVIGAIMQREAPSMSTIHPAIPALLDHLVSRCLAKDPDDRWQTASDLMRELKWIADNPEAAGPGAPVAPQPSAASWRRWTYIASFIAASLVGVVAYLILSPTFTRRAAAQRELPIRIPVAPPANTRLTAVQFAMSPDGGSVAYIGLAGEQRQLWVYSLATGESHLVAGAEDAHFPFWSPDSQQIGFFSRRALMRISAAGGPPQDLAPAFFSVGGGSGGAWSEESVILFPGRDNPCIYRIPSAGGTPTPVTTLDPSRDEVLHLHPRLLPGGKQFLYLARSRRPEYNGVYVRSLDRDDHKLLLRTLTHAEYAAPGYLLFVRNSVLLAQRFNLPRLELEGDPIPIAQPVSMNIDNGGAAVSASRDGSLVYYARADAPAALKWVDRQGNVPKIVGPRGVYRGVELSPDDRKVLVKTRGTEVTLFGDLWTIDVSRGISSRLSSGAESMNARWASDGEYVFYDSARSGAAGIYRKKSDGTGPEALVWRTGGMLADVSKEGRLLIEEGQVCTVVEANGKTKAAKFIESPSMDSCGRFSENGRFVAYTASESGRSEVYVVRFPEGAPRMQVSSDGGREPRWRKDGKELFYVAPDGKLMSVTLTYAPTLEASPPKELFQAATFTNWPLAQYSVARDGSQFLMIDPFEDPRAETLTVIAHWSDTLQR